MPDRFESCWRRILLILVTSVTVCGGIGVSTGLKGSPASCSQEGANYSLPNITGGQLEHDPCMHCVCQNSTVVCRQQTCEHLDTCPVVERVEEKGVCCRTCKGCSYAGQNYSNDQHWGSNQDACRTLTCKGGVVTIARMHCVTPCTDPERMTGYCCPLCPLASSSELVLGGPELAVLSDPCVRCQCDDAWCHCYRTACPALDCPRTNHYHPPGSCCPQCIYPRKELQLNGGRCVFKSIKYEHQQSFRPDPCTLCRCQDGSVICQRFVCPVVHCSRERLYYDPNLCCPRCRDKDPLGCSHLDKEYSHGEVWSLDSCTRCKCSNGETKCATEPCQYAHGCPEGYRIKKIKGQCCPECEEKEAICTVYGDPHYRTFDGRQYSFQGTCRYVLTQECILEEGRRAPSFIVIAQNDPLKTVGYSWTRHITVRLPEEKTRISLLRGKRVKENGRIVRLPHVRLGIYSVMRDKERNTVLRVNSVGLKVTWGKLSYVEVAVSARYKGRLCGLCGNYNHDISDDFAKSEGTLTHSATRFAQSWKYGSWKKCRSEKDRTFHKAVASRKRKKKVKERRRNHLISKLAWLHMSKGSRNSIFESSAGDEAGNKARKSSSQPEQRKRKRVSRRRRRLLKLCGVKWRSRTKQIRHCRLLKSQLFASCRDKIPVGRYYRWCIEDACACPKSGKCYCESLQAYARRCEESNILVEWTRASSCQETSVCSVAGAVFTNCAPTPQCISTCDSFKESVSVSCSENCVPGCVCPAGTVLHRNNCVTPKECP